MRRITNYARQHHLALVALFFALGGGAAWAADTIGSADIIDGEVSSADLRDGGVKAVDIGANQVRTSEVANNAVGDPESALIADDEIVDGSVDGQDVNEASLNLDIERVSEVSDDDSRSYKTITPECPAGKRVIGTGGDLSGSSSGTWPYMETHVAITSIVPYQNEVWVTAAEIAGGTDRDWELRGVAICARIAG